MFASTPPAQMGVPSHRAFLPLRDFKGEVQRVPPHTARVAGLLGGKVFVLSTCAALMPEPLPMRVDNSGEPTAETVSVDVLAVCGHAGSKGIGLRWEKGTGDDVSPVSPFVLGLPERRSERSAWSAFARTVHGGDLDFHRAAAGRGRRGSHRYR